MLVAGTVGLVGDSGKAVGKGDPEGEPVFTVLVGSVGRGTRLGDFGCVLICSWYGILWFPGSVV